MRVSVSLFDRKLALAVLAFGAPMALSMSMTALINSGTRWLIDALDSAEALGFYTAAFNLVQNTLALLGSGIAAAGYSLAVRAVEEGDPEVARRQLVANSTLLMAVLAPATVGMALTAHGLAATLVGHQFVGPVAQITPWMALGAGIYGFRANYLDHAFQLGRRSGLQVWVSIVAAIIAVGLSVLLIPRIGPVGAAIAVTVAMTVSCIHAWYLGRFGYRLPFPTGQFFRIGLACAAMAITVLFIPGGSPVAFAAQVALGGIAYAGVCIALDVMNTRARILSPLKRARARWHRKPDLRPVEE
jgi:O-antigen/teichoic acid export membrane protein